MAFRGVHGDVLGRERHRFSDVAERRCGLRAWQLRSAWAETDVSSPHLRAQAGSDVKACPEIGRAHV